MPDSIGRYSIKRLLDVVHKKGPGTYGPIGYDEVRRTIGRLKDKEVTAFLDKQLEKYSNNHSGNVCTCDGDNEALREYQVAEQSVDCLVRYYDFGEYVASEYSGREYYQLVWDEKDGRNCEGLDKHCTILGMHDVGTRDKFGGGGDYHTLRYAIESLDERDKDSNGYDDEVWYMLDKLTIALITNEYLSDFTESALKEQYKEIA